MPLVSGSVTVAGQLNARQGVLLNNTLVLENTILTLQSTMAALQSQVATLSAQFNLTAATVVPPHTFLLAGYCSTAPCIGTFTRSSQTASTCALTASQQGSSFFSFDAASSSWSTRANEIGLDPRNVPPPCVYYPSNCTLSAIATCNMPQAIFGYYSGGAPVLLSIVTQYLTFAL